MSSLLLELLDERVDITVIEGRGQTVCARPERRGTHAYTLALQFPTVRENACWALGYLKPVEAKDPLEQAAVDDEDETVRKRANWALTEIR